jgi:hypothetical protein
MLCQKSYPESEINPIKEILKFKKTSSWVREDDQ